MSQFPVLLQQEEQLQEASGCQRPKRQGADGPPSRRQCSSVRSHQPLLRPQRTLAGAGGWEPCLLLLYILLGSEWSQAWSQRCLCGRGWVGSSGVWPCSEALHHLAAVAAGREHWLGGDWGDPQVFPKIAVMHPRGRQQTAAKLTAL